MTTPAIPAEVREQSPASILAVALGRQAAHEAIIALTRAGFVIVPLERVIDLASGAQIVTPSADRERMEAAAKAMILTKGWEAGDSIHLHGVAQLMVEFAGTIRRRLETCEMRLLDAEGELTDRNDAAVTPSADHAAVADRLVEHYLRGPSSAHELKAAITVALAAAEARGASGAWDSPEAEFEVWQDHQPVASAEGEREAALRDIMHYAAMYSQDGPVQVFEVFRRPLPLPEAPQP